MLRLCFLFLFIAAAVAIESNFYYDEACFNATGFCVLESECPHPVAPREKNLCSGQRKQGAVCCTHFPRSQVNCYQLHEACMSASQCPQALNIGRKGCSDGQTCCVLV